MKANNNKDLPLKVMCKILFKELGYVTYYEVKLRTKSYVDTIKSHDISDIDVLAYNFLFDMTMHSLGSECKSGESSALDELYKFIGVKDYFGIQKGYLIKTKIHQNARQVSAKNNITCFTESELRILLIGFGIDIDKQIKIENAKYKKLIDSIKVHKDNIEKLFNYVTYEYWNKENWRSIHNILHLLNSNKNIETLSNDIQVKMFLYYIVELFSLSTLRIISKAVSQNFSDINSSLKNALYGGVESLIERTKIFDLVSQLTNENTSFSPEWESDFIDLTVRFSEHPKDSSRIIHMLQEIREESFYKTKIDIKQIVISKYSDLTRKYTQDIMHFITKHTKIDKSIFEDFMNI